MRIPAWKWNFELLKKELETILEREVLPTAVPEFPMVRRMTLGMNSPLVVPSLHVNPTVKKQQKEITDGWDPLLIGTQPQFFSSSKCYQNKLVDDAGKENERLDAPDVRGRGHLEDA